MPCAKENCGNIKSLPYFRGWGFFYPLECLCSVTITVYFLGAQLQRRAVAMAAEHKDHGHRTAARAAG